MRKCIKLLYKCILVMAPVLACAFFSCAFLQNIVSLDTIGIYWNKHFIEQGQDRYYSTVILGDSTANCSYLSEILSDSTINLSLSGTGVIENYYTLEDYLKYYEAPKDVYLSIADYHVAQDYFTWQASNTVQKFSIKQNYEIYKNIKEYSEEPLSEVIGENEYWPNVVLYKTYMPSKYMYSILKIFNDDRWIENVEMCEGTTTRLGRYHSISNKIFEPEGEVGIQEFNVTELQEAYYKKIIELCAANNIKLHIIKLPMPENVYFFEEYIDQIYAYYDELLEGYPNAEFLWPIQRMESYYFCDGTHLNNHGSLFFSKTLKALYPATFTDGECSKQRMLALEQDIMGENDYGYLSSWIDGFDYEIISNEENGETRISVKNNYLDEIVCTRLLKLNDAGTYELIDEGE